jgi:small-conductance mechanosensitive channel
MNHLNGLVNALLANERLLANLIAVHVVLGGLLVLSLILRKAFKHGINRCICWTEMHWLHGVHKHCHRGLRHVLFWFTCGLMVVAGIATVVYHFFGRDIRADLADWYGRVTTAHLFAVGITVGKLAIAALVFGVTFYLVRRLLARFEAHLHEHVLPRLPAPSTLVPVDGAPQNHHHNYKKTVRELFVTLERYLLASILLGGVWAAGWLADLARVDHVAGLLFRIVTILTASRLLTLSCRTISCVTAGLGDRHLGKSKLQRYWERVQRLFPFGERCFEAAVYISAASMCVRELEFIAFVGSYGHKIVKCIGVFFCTRVLIELLYVFINEAFGLYDEERPIDQKGLTLVPLLQSFSQYALYFGSGLFMLRAFEVDTTPILAGAGILGLAGGLGAQSLVTDVVSGFFILFENWYLVGDVVQIGDSVGRVEAVSIRHTQVRDEQGRLYIIPNGQIKTVTNFSKGYVNAVVDIKVPTSTNLAQVMEDMAEAGRRLRVHRTEVLAETVVKGLIDLSPSDMVIRAVTKVQPGTHLLVQQEYRRLLKEVFDQAQAGGTRALAA